MALLNIHNIISNGYIILLMTCLILSLDSVRLLAYLIINIVRSLHICKVIIVSHLHINIIIIKKSKYLAENFGNALSLHYIHMYIRGFLIFIIYKIGRTAELNATCIYWISCHNSFLFWYIRVWLSRMYIHKTMCNDNSIHSYVPTTNT